LVEIAGEEEAAWGFLDRFIFLIETIQARASQPPRKMVHHYLFHGYPDDIEDMNVIEVLARSSYLGSYPEGKTPS
jgi:hypothetical protein